MRFNKLIIKNFFNKNIYNFLNFPIAQKKKRNFKKISPRRENSFSIFKGFSKSEKYKNIFEKLNQFKKDELKQQKLKNKKS